MMPYANEQGYLQLLRDVISNGESRLDRTGTGTISIFAPDPLRFDISQTIPLYTTKRVPWKTVIRELLWFLRGETDAKVLQEENVHIWDGHTSKTFLRSRELPYREGVLGPGYGWQWRRFGETYSENRARLEKDDEGSRIPIETRDGKDQIAYMEALLKTDKFSRRIYMNSWNAKDLDKMALVPCHVACQFFVDKQDGLSCHVYMRSNDLFLGNPFNVFSYAVLTYLLAFRCNLHPKELVISFGDAHVYLDHVPAVNKQITRTPLAAPMLRMAERCRTIEYENMRVEDFTVEGYRHHPALAGKMSV